MTDKINLPIAFVERMKNDLGIEFDAFMNSFSKERVYGLRVNTLKTDKETLSNILNIKLEDVKWAQEGCYYEEQDKPGKSIYHEMGLFYIQEPSAMSAAEMLDPKPGEKILDLCAAPGGKSTQIGIKMKGEGLLVSNEIIPSRAKILSRNIERMGIENCVVTSMNPAELSAFFPVYFDRILVDAPCSGEGMFRKDEVAVSEWSMDNVLLCAKRQRDILSEAAKMLKPGGTLVYSTCTFSKDEDEDNVTWFLETFPDYKLDKQLRLWPHIDKGEGHFVAKLCKNGELTKEGATDIKSGKNTSGSSLKKANEIKEYLVSELGIDSALADEKIKSRNLVFFGEQYYLIPQDMVSLKGLKVERPGLHILTDKKGRFEPAFAFALALNPDYVSKKFELTSEQTTAYMLGESIRCDCEMSGFVLLTCKGYPVGFGKVSNGVIKNHYPKGLRRTNYA